MPAGPGGLTSVEALEEGPNGTLWAILGSGPVPDEDAILATFDGEAWTMRSDEVPEDRREYGVDILVTDDEVLWLSRGLGKSGVHRLRRGRLDDADRPGAIPHRAGDHAPRAGRHGLGHRQGLRRIATDPHPAVVMARSVRRALSMRLALALNPAASDPRVRASTEPAATRSTARQPTEDGALPIDTYVITPVAVASHRIGSRPDGHARHCGSM